MQRVLLFFLFFTTAVYGEDVITVLRVEIRGLVNLDRFDIMKDVRSGVKDKQIVIDVASLKRELDKNILIKDYRITGEQDSLIITVAEKYPVFNLVLIDENQSVPYLVDRDINILDSKRFFKTDMPIITAERALFEAGAGKNITAGSIGRLMSVKKEKPFLLVELAEISIYSADRIYVTMKNRRTLFVLENDYSGFLKLEKTAAFLDNRGSYPQSIDLRDNTVLVR